MRFPDTARRRFFTVTARLTLAEQDVQIASEAENGDTALELMRRDRPDVVLMDIRTPGNAEIARLL